MDLALTDLAYRRSGNVIWTDDDSADCFHYKWSSGFVSNVVSAETVSTSGIYPGCVALLRLIRP